MSEPSDDKGILAWLGEHDLATLVLVLLLAGRPASLSVAAGWKRPERIPGGHDGRPSYRH